MIKNNLITIINLNNISDDNMKLALDMFVERRKEFHKILDEVGTRWGGEYNSKVLKEAQTRFEARLEVTSYAEDKFPEINPNLEQSKNNCEVKPFDEIAREFCLHSETLRNIFEFFKELEDPDWRRIAERFDDRGLLTALYTNLIDSIREHDLDAIGKKLSDTINKFSEIKSLISFTECDINQKKAIFNLLDKDPLTFFIELTSIHVRVPHYETLILSYSILLDALDNNQIDLKVDKNDVKILLLNKYDLIIREFQFRKKILELIKIELAKSKDFERETTETKIDEYLINYKNDLIKIRALESNKLMEHKQNANDWKERILIRNKNN